MSADEHALVSRQYHDRIVEILSPEELARYEDYQRRLRAIADEHTAEPMEVRPEEQAVLDIIAADEPAAALHKQLMVLMRAEKLPQ